MLYLLYFLLFLLLGFVIFFSAWQIYTKILQPGAIYYPTTDLAVAKMLKLAKVNTQDTLIDLGSGDGRILIAAARLGVRAIGYEINPFLVRRSRYFIHEAKLDKLATVYWKSFWKADFGQATVVTVYLFSHLMNRLQRLLEKKVKRPTKIVVNKYPFTKVTPIKHHRKIYLYNFR